MGSNWGGGGGGGGGGEIPAIECSKCTKQCKITVYDITG